MKLKWQISIIAFLSLSFPLVVWLAFKALNTTYQNNMLAAADKQAQVILNSVEQYFQDRQQDLEGWVVGQLADDLAIDGQSPEWDDIPWYRVDHRLQFKLAREKQQLLLLIEVQDNSIFIDLNQPADRLVLALGENRGIKRININRQAEGPVFSQLQEENYHAYWHEMATGYRLEIALSDTSANRLGVAAINHDSSELISTFGTLREGQIQLTPFFVQQPSWNEFLSQITPEDGHLTIKDEQGRLLYQTNNIKTEQPKFDWLTEFIYDLAFDNDMNDGSHFFGQQVQKQFSAGGIELTVQHTQAQIALIQTFIRSVFWIFLIALTLLLGYFLYALILAWRIKRLNKTLQHVMDDRGRINAQLPSNQAKDEIGDLSRGMSTLLNQINEYTEYLKQLGSRLSHEMKTPISIVHTSLEVLHMEQPDNEFVDRALNANNRLKFILNQLSALSKLKQSIGESELEIFELNDFLAELSEGYKLNAANIQYIPGSSRINIQACKELMAQLLDKLIQNALDFTGAEDQITIAVVLSEKNHTFELTVTNTGSQIPETQLPQLFDSLTSFRTEQSNEPHLGLGLYIVKLICDFHQHEIEAHNLNQPTAVQFKITGVVK
ncbi:MAG: hypothetical protein KDI92_08630 [Xanthomonadales bacterium]|nr:hypothetical protein [Xanthomonadales bacterium]